MVNASRQRVSAVGRSPRACMTYARLLRLIATCGCSLPRSSRRIANASRKHCSASAYSFFSTSEKAQWLSEQVRAWRESDPHGELQILAWSDGATVLRKARLDDREGLYRDVRIANLAPPIAGSRRARWVDGGGLMPVIAFPAVLWLGRNPHLVQMAEDYNPYGNLMAEMYGPEANERLAAELGRGLELNVIAEGDSHAPSEPVIGWLEPDFEQFRARYSASLGAKHVRLARRTDNPHRHVTRHPDAIRAVERHFAVADDESSAR